MNKRKSKSEKGVYMWMCLQCVQTVYSTIVHCVKLQYVILIF